MRPTVGRKDDLPWVVFAGCRGEALSPRVCTLQTLGKSARGETEALSYLYPSFLTSWAHRFFPPPPRGGSFIIPQASQWHKNENGTSSGLVTSLGSMTLGPNANAKPKDTLPPTASPSRATAIPSRPMRKGPRASPDATELPRGSSVPPRCLSGNRS